jgi:hypothetical protein
MFKRFVAGSAVGALLIAVAALALVSLPGLALLRTWPLTLMWCFVPAAWGLWAVFTPRSWVPGRLPYWGAILGFIGGLTNALVLDMPFLVFRKYVPMEARWGMVAGATVGYYFLWMLVRAALNSIAPVQEHNESVTSQQVIKKAA